MKTRKCAKCGASMTKPSFLCESCNDEQGVIEQVKQKLRAIRKRMDKWVSITVNRRQSNG